MRHVLAAVDLGHAAPDGPRHAVEVRQAHGDEHEGDGAEFVMGLEVVLLLLSEPALLDALVVGVLGLEVDAPAALQGAAIVRLGLLGIAGEELALAVLGAEGLHGLRRLFDLGEAAAEVVVARGRDDILEVAAGDSGLLAADLRHHVFFGCVGCRVVVALRVRARVVLGHGHHTPISICSPGSEIRRSASVSTVAPSRWTRILPP